METFYHAVALQSDWGTHAGPVIVQNFIDPVTFRDLSSLAGPDRSRASAHDAHKMWQAKTGGRF